MNEICVKAHVDCILRLKHLKGRLLALTRASVFSERSLPFWRTSPLLVCFCGQTQPVHYTDVAVVAVVAVVVVGPLVIVVLVVAVVVERSLPFWRPSPLMCLPLRPNPT